MYDNERDKELLQAPYRRIARAEELVNSNALLDLYVSLYKKKYRGEPIFPVNRTHLTIIKDFARATGENAYAIMEHYFEQKDEWFIKQAYSLDCLIKNIHKISASYSQKSSHIKATHGKMSVDVFCDHCWKDMTILVSFNHDYDKTNRCEDCEKNGTPPKRVTKAQREQTLKIFSEVFKDVPKNDNPLV